MRLTGSVAELGGWWGWPNGRARTGTRTGTTRPRRPR